MFSVLFNKYIVGWLLKKLFHNNIQFRMLWLLVNIRRFSLRMMVDVPHTNDRMVVTASSIILRVEEILAVVDETTDDLDSNLWLPPYKVRPVMILELLAIGGVYIPNDEHSGIIRLIELRKELDKSLDGVNEYNSSIIRSYIILIDTIINGIYLAISKD